MMIHIEEEEQSRYIETFNQTDIRIIYYMDRQFRFEVPVSIFLQTFQFRNKNNMNFLFFNY